MEAWQFSLPVSFVLGGLAFLGISLWWRSQRMRRRAKLDQRVLRILITCAPVNDTLWLQSWLSRRATMPARSSRRTRAAICRLAKAGHIEITQHKWGGEFDLRLTEAGRRAMLPKRPAAAAHRPIAVEESSPGP